MPFVRSLRRTRNVANHTTCSGCDYIRISTHSVKKALFARKKHIYTCNFTVACSSLSEVTGKNRGSIIGYINDKTNIIGCWAAGKEGVQMVGYGDANAEINAYEQYQTSGDLTTDKVNEMNTAINDFNDTNKEQIQCKYKWEWVNGEWPKLVTNN